MQLAGARAFFFFFFGVCTVTHRQEENRVFPQPEFLPMASAGERMLLQGAQPSQHSLWVMGTVASSKDLQATPCYRNPHLPESFAGPSERLELRIWVYHHRLGMRLMLLPQPRFLPMLGDLMETPHTWVPGCPSNASEGCRYRSLFMQKQRVHVSWTNLEDTDAQ